MGNPVEVAPPDESAAIAKIVSVTKAKFERDNPANVRPALRGQHAKAHGTVRAEFEVAADVPVELRHGILRHPGTYPAWIRFSSSASIPQPDSERDVHGMAIKVMDVDGAKILESERDATTQDFVLANSRVFFCRNASDYVELATRASEGRILLFFLGANPARWHLRELVNLLVATRQRVHNPLQIRYWSQAPSALGPHVVKYSAKPQSALKDGGPASAGKDHLEEAMKLQLASAECRFDFMVQVRTDPGKMPVEDPTINWTERRSSFVRVATVRIPSQDFTSEAYKAFAEHLSFTPWHTLPEHRPMGGINRVRKAVYEVISDLRREKNGVPTHEPAGGEMP